MQSLQQFKNSCNNMKLYNNCNRKNCKYAHSPDQLIITKCKYGDDCKKIRIRKNRIGLWKVLNFESQCNFIHPSESNVNFFLRIGWNLNKDYIQAEIKRLSIVEKVSEEKVSEEKVSEEKVSEEKVSEEKVSEEKVSEEKVSEEKVSEEKVSEEKVSEETKKKCKKLKKKCKAIVKRTGKVCNNNVKDIEYDYCGKHKKWRK